MARTLTAKTSKLNWILRLTTLVPPSKNTDALKLSSFRRALKLALTKYTDGLEKILEVYRADAKEYEGKIAEYQKALSDEKISKKEKTEAEKNLKEVKSAIEGLQKEADVKATEYSVETDADTTVTFDNEAYNYAQNLFSEIAKDLFGQYLKDKDGNIKQEVYDNNAADELFELLDSAK